MKMSVAAIALMALVSGAMTLAQQAPPPAAPPPGSPALYKSDAELAAALKDATLRAGMQTAVVSNTDQYRINVIHRTQGAAPLTHAGNTELHHIIEGSATVVTGGKVVRDSSGAKVEGGVSRRVAKGDVILVPADTPHWYKEVESSVTYLEVRFVVPDK